MRSRFTPGFALPIIAAMLGLDVAARGWRLRYSKGDYFTVAPRLGAITRGLVYPVPRHAGLGVHVTMDLGGSYFAGPDVEYVSEPQYDVDERKEAAARSLGVPFRVALAASPDADIVVHTSGSGMGLTTALGLAGVEAMIVEASWYGDDAPAVPLGGAFHSRRLTLKSSQVGAVAAAQRARWSHARRMELVMKLLENAELDALVTGESPFEELPAVLARLAASPGYTLTHRIAY